MRRVLGLFILIGFCGLSYQAEARIDIKNTKLLILPSDISEPIIEPETSRRIQPTSAVTGESGSSVASKMVDNTVSLWWETTPIRQTSLGRTAEKVEKNMKAEVEFGKSKNSEVEHKIGIKLLAMQSLARLEYKGWVRAGINYDAKAATTEAEVLENLAKNKDLVVSHLITTSEKKSQVSFRWNW